VSGHVRSRPVTFCHSFPFLLLFLLLLLILIYAILIGECQDKRTRDTGSPLGSLPGSSWTLQEVAGMILRSTRGVLERVNSVLPGVLETYSRDDLPPGGSGVPRIEPGHG